MTTLMNNNAPKSFISYHFTNPGGLDGILSSSVLRATCVAYCNDSQEVTLGQQVFKERIAKFMESAKAVGGTEYRHLYETLVQESDNVVSNTSQFHNYVCCFCTHSNLLSQWRGYASEGTGYALEFDLIELTRYSSRSAYMVEVAYSEEQQHAMFRMFIKEIAGLLRNPGDISEDDIKRVVSFFSLFPSTVKHEGFASEFESRIVINTGYAPDTPVKIFFRPAKGLYVPYVEIPFEKKLLRSVTVGPCHDFEKAKYGLRLHLDYLGYTDTRIEYSGIPFLP